MVSEVYKLIPLCLNIILREIYLFVYRTTSANRSLPDIPKDKSSSSENRIESTPQDVIYEATETIGDNLELYATVQDKGMYFLVSIIEVSDFLSLN